MTSDWYLIQHVPDLFRNEPHNIGVVVIGDDGSVGSRFIGEVDGAVDGRRVPRHIGGVETYKAWIKFIVREAHAGRLDERIESLSARADSYTIKRRGPVFGDLAGATTKRCAVDLFHALVTEETPREPTLDELADKTLSKLLFPSSQALERSVAIEVEIRKGAKRNVEFDYRFQNGKVTLMDKVSLSRQGKPLTQMVNDLLFRIEHVERERKAAAFVVMHHHGNEMAERQLSQIEKYAYTVDVGDEDAASAIGHILGVPLLPALQT